MTPLAYVVLAGYAFYPKPGTGDWVMTAPDEGPARRVYNSIKGADWRRLVRIDEDGSYTIVVSHG